MSGTKSVTTTGSIPEFAAHATPEMAALINEVVHANERNRRTLRRKIRYRLFRIRDAAIDPSDSVKCERAEMADKGLKRWMELQFHDDMNWNSFTFRWDVSYEEPLKLITPFEWDGQVVQGRCDPAAFTHQKG